MKENQEYVGEVYGRMTILGKSEGVFHGKKAHRYFDCECTCGSKKAARLDHLLSGKIVSCGCNRHEKRCRKRTHGMAGTKTYSTWLAMRTRCTNPNYAERHLYSGRGITVCDRWLNSFENFLEDMGAAPDGMSIDRIDNDGNYEPSNCRWASAKDQANNRRVPVRKGGLMVDYKGVSYKVADLSELLGVSLSALYRRIERGAKLDENLPKGVPHGYKQQTHQRKPADAVQ